MPTDVPTEEIRDEHKEQAPADEDTQVLNNLLVRAFAEMQEVTDELICSSKARVEGLANRISQLENGLAK